MHDVHSTMPMWQQIVEGYKLKDKELINNFHVKRHIFHWLLGLVRDHPSISYDPSSPIKQYQQLSPELHLLVMLKYFGSKGNDLNALKQKGGYGSHQRNDFELCKP